MDSASFRSVPAVGAAEVCSWGWCTVETVVEGMFMAFFGFLFVMVDTVGGLLFSGFGADETFFTSDGAGFFFCGEQ